MPRTNLIREDPRAGNIRQEIKGRMAKANIKNADLARATGIPASTLYLHLKEPGTLRLGDYWKIDDALKRRGA